MFIQKCVSQDLFGGKDSTSMHMKMPEPFDRISQRGHAKIMTHPLVHVYSPQVNQAILHN